MHIKKIICSAVAVSVLGLSMVGCYGSYGLTNTVHNIGKNVASSNKYVGGLVYLILGMPVGGFCMFADWLIFNTIEFWTGAKIFAMNDGDTFEQYDESTGATLLATKNADGSLTLTSTDADGKVSEIKLVRDENVVRAIDKEGTVVAMQTIEE